MTRPTMSNYEAQAGTETLYGILEIWIEYYTEPILKRTLDMQFQV